MGRSALGLYLAALLGGILAGDALPSLCGPALLSAPAMLVAALWQRRRASFSIGWLTLGCLAAGAALPARWTAPLPPSDLTRVLCEGRADCDEPVRVTLAGTLDAHPRPGNGNTRLYLSVEDVIRDARRAPVRGRVRVRVGGETPGLRAGARVLLQARLRAPRRYRNPGCADLPRALARQGIHRAAAVASARDVVPLASRSARRAGFAAARERLSGFFRRRTPEEAPVLAALLLGEGGRIGPSLRDAYARAGVAHVLAVSGLHVAIVAMTVAALLRGVLGVSTRLLAGGAAWRIALLGGTAAAWGYALLAGGREPGLRAAGMAATLVAAALVRRRGDVWYALLLAAAGLTLGDPARVFQPGVQLSFLSVAGLLGFWRLPRRGQDGSGRVGRLARWAVRWALASMRASVGATLATLPVQASLSSRSWGGSPSPRCSPPRPRFRAARRSRAGSCGWPLWPSVPPAAGWRGSLPFAGPRRRCRRPPPSRRPPGWPWSSPFPGRSRVGNRDRPCPFGPGPWPWPWRPSSSCWPKPSAARGVRRRHPHSA
jgi:ComEC/Rec2-related protein